MEKQCFVNECKCYFNLRSKKNDKPTNVYMITRIAGKQVKLSTNVKVYPSQWNSERQEAYISPRLTELDNENNSIVNSKISELCNSFNEYKEYLCANPNELVKSKEVLTKFIYKNNPMANKVSKVNAIHKLNELVRNDSSIKDSSKADYIRQLTFFDKFLISVDKSPLSFDDVNLILLKEYERYLYSKIVNEKKKETTKTSTVNNKVCKIVAILKRAEDYGLIDVSESKIDRYKKTKVKEGGDNEIYLKEEEIERMYKLKLSGNEEKVRDVFVLLCYIGQRFKDVIKINNGITKQGDNGTILEIGQTKYVNKISIPLLPIAEEILNKYEYKMPIIPTSTALLLLKKIGRMADIVWLHLIQDDRGGRIIEANVEACDLIGTHTARRSFVSNMLKRGYEAALLMKITGHSTMESFKKYVKLTSEDAALTILLTENNKSKPNNDNAKKELNDELIREAKEVLTMMQVDPFIVTETNDREMLWRMVMGIERELLDYGIDYLIVKEIFNEEKTLKERADILHQIFIEAKAIRDNS